MIYIIIQLNMPKIKRIHMLASARNSRLGPLKLINYRPIEKAIIFPANPLCQKAPTTQERSYMKEIKSNDFHDIISNATEEIKSE